MAREKFCPKCGEDITDSYEAEEPDVGIMSSGWYCDKCEHPVPDDEDSVDWDAMAEKRLGQG